MYFALKQQIDIQLYFNLGHEYLNLLPGEKYLACITSCRQREASYFVHSLVPNLRPKHARRRTRSCIFFKGKTAARVHTNHSISTVEIYMSYSWCLENLN